MRLLRLDSMVSWTLLLHLRGLNTSQQTGSTPFSWNLSPARPDKLLITGGFPFSLQTHLDQLHCFHVKPTTTSHTPNLMHAATFKACDSNSISPIYVRDLINLPNPLLFKAFLLLSRVTIKCCKSAFYAIKEWRDSIWNILQYRTNLNPCQRDIVVPDTDSRSSHSDFSFGVINTRFRSSKMQNTFRIKNGSEK